MFRKSIQVESMAQARLFKCDVPWAAISIVTDVGGNPELSDENRIGLLNMAFADADFAHSGITEEMLFNKQMAKQILDFVSEMWPKVECFLIHCHFGMSRSPAVAAAIEHVYYGRGADNWWFERKCPNMLVYRTILNTHYAASPPATTG